VDGVPYTAPKTFSWVIGSTHSIGTISPQSGSTGIQYVWTGWSDGGDVTHDIVVPSTSTTYTAYFKTQYYLTVYSPYGSPTPTSGWFDAGTSIIASVNSPVDGPTGTRYVCTGWTGTGSVPSSGTDTTTTFTINEPSSITWNWKTQYYLMVNTYPAGLDSPTGEGWYDSGVTVHVSTAQYANVTAETSRYRFDHWDGATGDYSDATVVMDGAKTATAVYQLQYYLTVTTNPAEVLTLNSSAVSGEGWYDSGATATVDAVQLVNKVTGQSRYDFRSWTGATPTGVGNQATVLMDGPKTVTANYQLQYKVSLAQSGVGSDFTGTVVIVDGTDNLKVSDLPKDYWWDAGSSHTFAFQSPLTVDDGKHYVWTGTSGLSTLQSDTLTISGAGTLTGNYKTQYYLTMSTNYGTVSPGSGWYDEGSVVTISATAPSAVDGERYVWLGWTGSGDGSYTGTDNPASITMNGPITETAAWAHQYYLTVRVSPPGFATISGEGWYDEGTNVTLAAPGIKDYDVYWDLDGTTYPRNEKIINVTMDAPHTATAIYEVHVWITRTQGFWATHYKYTWNVWSGIEDKAIGSKVIDDEGKLFGAFWSSISKTSTGGKRSLLDQAKMQLLQQLVAAMLNVQAFGDDSAGTAASLIAAGKAAFSGNDRTAILNIAYQLGLFNSSGDNQPLPPGVIPGSADPGAAQSTANKAFWDTL